MINSILTISIVLQKCIGCGKLNCFIFKGAKFKCHEESSKYRLEHSSLCYDCASGKNVLAKCPKHNAPAYTDRDKYKVKPVLISEIVEYATECQDQGVSE